jgi:hypothetical protein
MRVRPKRRLPRAAARDDSQPYTPRSIQSLRDLIDRVEQGTIPVPSGVRADTLAASLSELDAFVGAARIKQLVTNMVVMVCLGLHDPDDFTNVSITGNPGTGKTSLLTIIADIWCTLFHNKRGGVTWLCRPQLIGEHLGETACKTARALASAAPGVVVIDEVYSLGAGASSSKGDSFAKECVDTLNQFISECRKDLTVVVAGYKEETSACFFAQNPGLMRRFPWQFTIEDYTTQELVQITALQIARSGWSACEGWSRMPAVLAVLGASPNNGGDTQKLLHECKMSHALRVPAPHELRVLTEDDIANACKRILEDRPDTKQQHALHLCGMYT